MSLPRRAWLAVVPAWGLLAAGCAATAAPAARPTREWRGVLSRKGSPPGVFWALLDDAGREWRLTPSAGWDARLLALQGRRVRLTGRIGDDPQGDEIELTAVDPD
jgi:hypothetical protein